MLILHCLWMDGDFFIWGEDDTTPLCIKMKGRLPRTLVDMNFLFGRYSSIGMHIEAL